MNKLKKTLSVLLIAAFMLSAAGCSVIDYKKAEKLKNDGDYAAAQEMYIALGDYKDSAELADVGADIIRPQVMVQIAYKIRFYKCYNFIVIL